MTTRIRTLLVQSSNMRLRAGIVLAAVLAMSPSSPILNAREPVRTRHAMVVAEESLAAEVGVSVLKSGGNAVDAAVAVGFALAVTHPFAGNLGGGGFMLIRFADSRSTFLDFRERAPEKATRGMYLDGNGQPTQDSVEGVALGRRAGHGSAASSLAQSKYGRKKWPELIAPAIALASKGFPVNHLLAESLKNAKNLSGDPESNRIYQRGGKPYQPGETLAQPDLAMTLARIAQTGGQGFL